MMDFLWQTDDLVNAMKGRPVGEMPEGVNGITIDSRNLNKGDLFFAIKGDRFDGHDFASNAFANGAGILVVCEAKIPALGHINAPMIVVDDVLDALVELGKAARERSSAKIVAVTGSVGKTTTKEMFRHVLSSIGRVHASVASFNNHWGVPLTLARLPADADFGIFEIGMNHPEEIRPLVKMVRPHLAMVTTVAAAHLGNFKSLNEIARAKAEIFDGVVKNGFVVLNHDNDKFSLLKKAAAKAGVKNIFSFGKNQRASFRLENYKLHESCSCFNIKIKKDTIAVKIGVPGLHIVENALGVIGACSLLGADLTKITHALVGLSAEKGRGKRYQFAFQGGHITLVDESYNANPASMKAAIKLLGDVKTTGVNRRIAVLGDMLELGEFSEELHQDLKETLVAANINLVFLAGHEMEALHRVMKVDNPVYYFSNTEELLPGLLRAIRSGDTIMVKSSLGIGFGKIVQAFIDKFEQK